MPYLCPKCGKRTMRKMRMPDGTYILVCSLCGLKKGPVKPDKKKGVA